MTAQEIFYIIASVSLIGLLAFLVVAAVIMFAVLKEVKFAIRKINLLSMGVHSLFRGASGYFTQSLGLGIIAKIFKSFNKRSRNE